MLKVTPCLNKVLQEKGFSSQAAFAKEYGFSQKTINSFDTSVQHRDELLFRIARALGVNVEDLFEVEEIEDNNE